MRINTTKWTFDELDIPCPIGRLVELDLTVTLRGDADDENELDLGIMIKGGSTMPTFVRAIEIVWMALRALDCWVPESWLDPLEDEWEHTLDTTLDTSLRSGQYCTILVSTSGFNAPRFLTALAARWTGPTVWHARETAVEYGGTTTADGRAIAPRKTL